MEPESLTVLAAGAGQVFVSTKAAKSGSQRSTLSTTGGYTETEGMSSSNVRIRGGGREGGINRVRGGEVEGGTEE